MRAPSALSTSIDPAILQGNMAWLGPRPALGPLPDVTAVIDHLSGWRWGVGVAPRSDAALRRNRGPPIAC
jgi:hypothetical protein